MNRSDSHAIDTALTLVRCPNGHVVGETNGPRLYLNDRRISTTDPFTAHCEEPGCGKFKRWYPVRLSREQRMAAAMMPGQLVAMPTS